MCNLHQARVQPFIKYNSCMYEIWIWEDKNIYNTYVTVAIENNIN